MPTVLLIEDHPGDARLVQEQLAKTSITAPELLAFDLEWVDSLAGGLARLDEGGVDAILADLGLPDSQGLDTFARLHAHAPHVPIVVLTALQDTEAAVRAIRAGAQDYLPKGEMNGHVLIRALRYAMERQQMMETLRLSQAFNQAMIDHAPVGISVRDRNGRLLFANAVWAKIWAIPAAAVRADMDCERVELTFDARDDYLRPHHAEVRHVYEQGGSCYLPELRTIHPRPGGAEWVAQHFYAIQDEQGQVDRVIILTEDITARKRSEHQVQYHARQLAIAVDIEHALASSLDRHVICEHLARGLQRLAPDAATIFISKFDAEREMITALYGLQDGEVVDVSALPEMPLAPPGAGMQSQVIRTRQPLVIAADLPKKLRPGKAVRVGSTEKDTQSALYVPMLAQDEVLGVIQLQSYVPYCFTEDDARLLSLVANTAAVAIQNARLYELAQSEIAERQRAEAALQSAYEELQRTQAQLVQSAKLAAVGELAAGVAHEINNPLTGVLGFAELLLQTAAPDDPIREDLGIIVQESKRVRDIVRGLLSFSRQTPAHRNQAHINLVVQETLDLVRQRLEKSGVTLEEQYAPDLPILHLDVSQIKQVVLNLVVNAIQSTRPGDRLTVSTKWAGNEVALRVADTGVGIPAENLARIFEPFFTTKPTGQGTGLGLSISLGIVREHGGRIEVESREGEGSTFTVWLPADKESQRDGQPDGEPQGAAMVQNSFTGQDRVDGTPLRYHERTDPSAGS